MSRESQKGLRLLKATKLAGAQLGARLPLASQKLGVLLLAFPPSSFFNVFIGVFVFFSLAREEWGGIER